MSIHPAAMLLIWLGSILLTGLLRKYALNSHILDLPNRRSSHVEPTPRGGGMAIVIVVALGIVWLGIDGRLPKASAISLLLPGLMIAWVGWLDDCHGVKAGHRLMVHLLAAAGLLGGTLFPHLLNASQSFWLIVPLAFVIILSLGWFVNLYNFMDGIDGLAGVEAVTVAGGAALLLQTPGPDSGLALLCVITALAALGFLFWNWPPAKVFMGDGGSGFLGFLFAGLALLSVMTGLLSLWIWLILLGVFIVDASLTLLSRLWFREPVFKAHCSHAYQRMARRFSSHAAVTVGVGLINLLWLLPLAFCANVWLATAPFVCVLAWLPLVALWVWAARCLPGG